jgi:hypothetical protein
LYRNGGTRRVNFEEAAFSKHLPDSQTDCSVEETHSDSILGESGHSEGSVLIDSNEIGCVQLDFKARIVLKDNLVSLDNREIHHDFFPFRTVFPENQRASGE